MGKEKGLWIPEELLEDRSLTLTEIFVLATVISLSGKEGCYARNDYIAERCRCTKELVSRTLTKGEKMGILSIIRNGPHTRIIQSTLIVGSTYNDRRINVQCPQDQRTMIVGSTQTENLPNNIYNKHYNKHFIINARTREEEKKEEIANEKIPTVDEVKQYCAEKGYSWDAGTFWNYNNARGWQVGGKPVEDWHSLAALWKDREVDKADAVHPSSFDADDFFTAALARSYDFSDSADMSGDDTPPWVVDR